MPSGSKCNILFKVSNNVLIIENDREKIIDDLESNIGTRCITDFFNKINYSIDYDNSDKSKFYIKIRKRNE